MFQYPHKQPDGNDNNPQPRGAMIASSLCINDRIGPYTVKAFLARGGNSFVCLGEDSNGSKVALKLGYASGGGRYITRMTDASYEKDPNRISPDETPAEGIR
jgi:hypothetical protein